MKKVNQNIIRVSSQQKKVTVGTSKIPNAGRGVFAKVNINKGEIIEKCPFIEIHPGDISLLENSILISYFFYFGRKKEKALIALGLGSIYNHSDNPNARFKINSKTKFINFSAVKDIKKNEEITFNYKNNNSQKAVNTPLWFET